ncbi:ROK family protein [Sphingobacterium bovistauri]|uniref:ROK family protein n=1 Tax=Sphingobacterium bovistauri TaxID=2781959 RepID=A0ABS7Z3B9_9SPHI|nr:ROK family protein [Sphingobacterium bovistauri]MCA5004680.1 ROK family protein [Sphingobacterium bovistauri]
MTLYPKYILSCDIGGTHITSAIVDTNEWVILSDTLSRSHINSSSNAKSIFHNWASNIKSCLNKFNIEIQHIGIAMPGPFDYDNGISLMKNQDKYDAIYKLDTTNALIEELGKQYEIKYINDAAAFLQGEIFAQGLENKDKVLGITLGTGLGSAVWSNGEKAFDADLWKISYKDSIFEESLVTRWFTKRFEQLKGIKENGLKEIIDNHQNSTEFDQLLTEYSTHLEAFLSYFSELHHCNHFIIGGNIAKAWHLIDRDNKFSAFKITKAQYAEKAALIGAASIF